MNCKRMALTAALLLALPLVASAAVPYTSYTYDSYGNAVTTSHIYEPASVLSGQDMKAGQLTEPRDMSLSPSGELYILDSGNGRVIVLDRQLRLNRIVTPSHRTARQPNWINQPACLLTATAICTLPIPAISGCCARTARACAG